MAKDRLSKNLNQSVMCGHPFSIFKHVELFQALDPSRFVSKPNLMNHINYLHFNGGSVLIHMQHSEYGDDLILQANPQPAVDDCVICKIPETTTQVVEENIFFNLLILRGKQVIIVPAEIKEIDQNAVKFQLPEHSYAVNKRYFTRYKCRNIDAELYQNAFFAKGRLVDYSAFGFRIEFLAESMPAIRWFNSGAPVTLCLRRDKQIVLTSSCHCIRLCEDDCQNHLVLSQSVHQMSQFQKRKLRNPRVRLSPHLEMVFDHPFLEKKFRREVYDISSSGFSVLEKPDNAVLLPGMILRDFKLNFAGAFDLNCILGQAVYSQKHDEKSIRCGFAILDMDIRTYSSLNNILGKSLDKNTEISNEVDLDELWKFLFETGFLYPDKYHYISENSDEFKKTYYKLYKENPEIIRHFTYQKNGFIYGHISMIRAYERTWMFQHLAAKALEKSRSGIVLLKQINHFTNELYRMPSAKMDYLMCYYRPKNHFSRQIFGGFAKECESENKKGVCAEDLFAYSVYSKEDFSVSDLPEGWEIRKYCDSDFWDLDQFYKHRSGGMLLKVLQLSKCKDASFCLEKTYEKSGLLRKTEIYSIFCRGLFVALLVADQSNIGFNLSNLLNSIKIIVLHPDKLPSSVFQKIIGRIIKSYETEKTPVLVYPYGYFESMNQNEKTRKYIMWCVDARHVSEFMDFSKKKFKIFYW